MLNFLTELKIFELSFQEWLWGYKAYITPAPFLLLALLYIYKHYVQKQHVSVRQLLQWFVVLTILIFMWLKTLYTLSGVGKTVRAQYLFPQDSWSYVLMQSMLCNFGLCIGYFLMFVTRWTFVRCVQGRQVSFDTFFDEQVQRVSVYRVVSFVLWMNFFFYATSQGWI